jgi:hypothetical protein
MPTHIVAQGECLSSIAEANGLYWKTIWQHAENMTLRQLRGDPNVLAPGDELFIPEKIEKQIPSATQKKHSFVKKGVPAQLKIRLLSDGQPRANLPYTLHVDGCLIKKDKTDGDGYISASIPPNAQTGMIIVEENSLQDIYNFDFGNLDPADSENGIRGRLRNLGYPVDEDFAAAVKAFQAKAGLDATGEVDANTRQQLKERFGE